MRANKGDRIRVHGLDHTDLIVVESVDEFHAHGGFIMAAHGKYDIVEAVQPRTDSFQITLRNASGLLTPEVIQKALERGGLMGAKVTYA